MKIENGRYWNQGWQLIDGCTPCSPGCDHCWSASMAHRFRHSRFTGDDGRFNGAILIHSDRLSIPLKRRKPTVYAIWNDWCHKDVGHVFRHKMVIKAEFNEQHTFLALTKRPKIMLNFWESVGQHVPANWWNGLTICNQEEADEKIPIFLRVPGKKFVSHEPALERIDYGPELEQIDCLISGGETGACARPSHPDIFRADRNQCEAAGVPFFFKSWGAWKGAADFADGKMIPGSERKGRLLDGREHNSLGWRSNDEE